MDLRKINVEHFLYGLALLLALGIRLLFLGSIPLSDPEAGWALQALGLARGDTGLIGGQPGYVVLTGAIFFLFGNADLLARLVPAVAGSLLALAPFLVRDRIGRRAAVLLAFGLALDPGMVSLSREAGSAIVAISFTVLALCCWVERKGIAAGIFTGLAILGGQALWGGLLGMALAGAVFFGLLGSKVFSENGDLADEQPAFSPRWARIPATAALVTLLLAGTLFFRAPRGLSAVGDSLAASVNGWAAGNGISPATLLTAFIGSELISILVGGWVAIRGWVKNQPFDRLMSIWLVIALILAFANPGRQTGDLAWALIPLWVLAARGISRMMGQSADERAAGWVYTAVVLVVIGFLWLNFTGFLIAWQADQQSNQARVLAILGGVILLVAATLLVTWGWSSRVATQGLFRGGLLALVVYLIAGATASAGFRAPVTAETWRTYPRLETYRDIDQALGDLSFWRTGNRTAIDVVSLKTASPSLRWYLRKYPQAQFADILAINSQPSIVITPEEEQPALAASYRGQSLLWSEEPDWASMSLFQRVSWFAFHQAPMKKTNLILWARTDVFLAANP